MITRTLLTQLNLDEALEMNIIGDGSAVIFLGLGAGLTWVAVLARLVG